MLLFVMSQFVLDDLDGIAARWFKQGILKQDQCEYIA